MKKNKKNILSIIIINWNTKEYLHKALISLQRYRPKTDHQIIIVDNASTDNSPKMVKQFFPEVILIAEPVNQGFAKAVNKGIAFSNSSFYLLMNSDCELQSQIIDQLIDMMKQNDKIGILAPILIYPDGTLQSVGEPLISPFSIFKSQILFSKSSIIMRFKKGEFSNYQEVGFVSGAFMLIRDELIRQIGMFREDYCYRAKKAGWEVGICYNVRVVHHKSKSTEKNLKNMITYSIINNCKLIYEYYGKLYSYVSFLFFVLGISLRTIFSILFLKNNAKGWFKLWLSLPSLFRKVLFNDNGIKRCF